MKKELGLVACGLLVMVVGLTSIRRHRLTAAELKMAPAVVRD